MPDAVMFDLDGVLVDSEQLWNEAKEELVRSVGAEWPDYAPTAMLGMSSVEWTRYMHDELHVALDVGEINRRVLARMSALYREDLPLLPGAVATVRALGGRWPLGLASSSNRELIDLFLSLSGLADAFVVAVSSEEVKRGKPSPDVYLEAARKMAVDARRCVAIEDSTNGMRAAAAAGMALIAVPNPHYPPSDDALALAGATVAVVGEVTTEMVEQVAGRSGCEV